VAVSDTDANPAAAADKPTLGRAFGSVNVEAVVAYRPDIVFAYGSVGEALADKGVPVFVIETCSVCEVPTLIKKVGKTVGEQRAAKKMASRMEERIARITSKTRRVSWRPLVYFEAGSAGSSRGPGSLTHDLIVLAGGRNLAAVNQNVAFPKLSAEYVIKASPDIVLLEEYGCEPEDIVQRPGWENIPAVQQGNIHRCPMHYTNYTPRCVEGLEQFARWFHPALFEED
jgi:iron complex transport system substrate-binding protein